MYQALYLSSRYLSWSEIISHIYGHFAHKNIFKRKVCRCFEGDAMQLWRMKSGVCINVFIVYIERFCGNREREMHGIGGESLTDLGHFQRKTHLGHFTLSKKINSIGVQDRFEGGARVAQSYQAS